MTTDEKQRQWQQIEAACRTITDALGEPIDQGILPLVIALNVLDIRTSASCAGHLDHGTYAPYIDLEALIDQDEERAARQALWVAQEAAEHEHSQEEIDILYREATKLQQQAGYAHLELRARLSKYLTRFYETRRGTYNQRLVLQGEVLQGIGCPMRLESQGAGLQVLANPEELAENLRVYQDEMQAFAKFLKEIFMEGC